jgi:alpha-mannosidase
MRHQIRWTGEKISRRIKLIESLTYRQSAEIPPFHFKYLNDPLDPPPVAPDVDDSTWDVIQTHEYWANPRTNFVLRTKFTVPAYMKTSAPIALFLPIGIAGDFSHPEALVYIDGEPLAGCDRHHQEIVLPHEFCDGKEHTLALHGWTGIGGSTIGDLTSRLKMNPSQVVQIDPPTRDFVALARVTIGIIGHLEGRNPTKHHLLNALDEAIKIVDIRNPIGEAFYDSISFALVKLRSGIKKAGLPLDVEITAIGHAHIDVAWLWTLGQTRRKAGRTFHTVLHLMEQYPNYIFGQSQPQLYDYIRHDYPELFEIIKDRVAEGRWETIGGMWVEADCNLSGSESLARQFLLGRSFFRKHFGEGIESPVLWLPDVFGYAWNLPQLIKEAGLEYFFTIKIGWSQYNRLPYDSFWWQGLDGTQVLTHFSTTKEPGSSFAATYNSDASPAEVMGTWTNFQQKDYGSTGKIPPLLISYGYGDGGGGPTREMLENIREMGNFPSTPKVHTGKVSDFFKALEAASEHLPTWNGELYLEYHRGTYTTQARNKRANRKSEFLLHDAEFLATYASLLDPEYQYPYENFTKAWRLVCLNQFHDIIPGSSIGPVYAESLEQYEHISQIGEEICDRALGVIAAKLGASQLLVNPTSFSRAEPAMVDGKLSDLGDLPAYSITAMNTAQQPQAPKYNPPIAISGPQPILENDFLRVEFNQAGDITRIYDKNANREVLLKGTLGNQFQAFEDIPLSWDAWDIDIYYDDKMWLAEAATSIEVVEDNPLRATLEVRRKVHNSDYTQKISLTHNSPRLDFDTQIDWQERQILLKVAFPVDILSPTATYEIQWGNVERPTHRNTSWDWARFETVAQKWVDLSEGDYGVSLLNDCKYGHDIRDNVMRLTLLRGTTAPDPMADFGEHNFKYSLFPHIGKWNEKTIAEAYALNDPVIVFEKGDGGQMTEYSKVGHPSPTKSRPLISVNEPNIIIETIKRAEDGDGIIVRLYESQRRRGEFTLNTAFTIAQAWRDNILEENQESIPVHDNLLKFQIKPYQILTLRIKPDQQKLYV